LNRRLQSAVLLVAGGSVGILLVVFDVI